MQVIFRNPTQQVLFQDVLVPELSKGHWGAAYPHGHGEDWAKAESTADEKTIGIVKGLGQIQATSKECAAVLGVTEPTWIKFKRDNLAIEDALRDGQGEGLASLRRRQFKAAQDGNATMLVWLGKQYLGQTDKQAFEHTGANGGPIQTLDMSNLSDDDLSRLEAILGPLAGAAGDDLAAGEGGTSKTRH